VSVAQDAVSKDEDRSYKRVAIVEEFFQIIHSVHVDMDGRGGKHAGQKRTYRAVSGVIHLSYLFINYKHHLQRNHSETNI